MLAYRDNGTWDKAEGPQTPAGPDRGQHLGGSTREAKGLRGQLGESLRFWRRRRLGNHRREALWMDHWTDFSDQESEKNNLRLDEIRPAVRLCPPIITQLVGQSVSQSASRSISNASKNRFLCEARKRLGQNAESFGSEPTEPVWFH